MARADPLAPARMPRLHSWVDECRRVLLRGVVRSRTRNRARFGLLWLCAVAAFVSTILPATAAEQPDPRIPMLRGLHAVTVVATVYIDGSARTRTGPCRLEDEALERHGAEILHAAGLDAIGGMDRITKMQAIVSETRDALGELQNAPPGTNPPHFLEDTERRKTEMAYLGSQPALSVHIGVATLDGGICAAGITTEFRALVRQGDQSVINYNNEKVRVPLVIWGTPLFALAAPTTELEHAVTERLDRQLSAFVTAWRMANGQ